MKRLRRIAALVACLALGGCTVFFPITAEVVYPNTLDDLLMALVADMTQWLMVFGL